MISTLPLLDAVWVVMVLLFILELRISGLRFLVGMMLVVLVSIVVGELVC